MSLLSKPHLGNVTKIYLEFSLTFALVFIFVWGYSFLMPDITKDTKTSGHTGWNIALWVIGSMLIIDGSVILSQGRLVGPFIMLMGLVLLPLFWTEVAKRSKFAIENRYKIGVFFVSLCLFLLIGQLTEPTSIQTTSSTPIKHTQTKLPTPTPNDPCWQFAGTDQIQQCAQMEDAKAKGEALQYPLKAKITLDSLYLYATNLESNEWDNCTATLDDTNPEADNFQSDVFTLKPGEEQTISWGNFANAEGQRFNYFQTKPNFVDVDCTVNNQEHRSLFNL